MNGFQRYRNAWRYDGPPHLEQRLEKAEWKALLRQGGLLVRNTYDFDSAEETAFWYVIKDQEQGLEELSSRVRNKIRHANNAFDYRLIGIEKLFEEAYPIIKETYDDYPVKDRKMNQKVFEQYLSQCEKTTFDYWGVFDKNEGKMVGFCTVRLWDRCCEYGVTGILTRYKSNGLYPYYGLYQTMNQHYLRERGFEYVSDSARSITEHSHIQQYLIGNFNFRKAYCKLEIHYNWWMRLAVRCLYPFRKIITIPKVKAILNMESMTKQKK
mgnify:CR=1 FL=1